jgi:probable HAF family extracellular repeat protein
MFVATPVHSTMGKGAARQWRALWLVWVVVAWAALPSLAQRLIWLGTLPGGDRSYATGVSADGSVVVGWAATPQGSLVPFAGRRRVGCRTSARWAAVRAGLGAFPPMAPWWSAGLTTPQGRIVPFAGRRRVGCRTSARWAAIESEASGVSADGSVVVGWAYNAAGQYRAFRWTAARGMQDLGTLPGGMESVAFGVSADGSVVVGWAYDNAAGHASCLSLDGGGWDAGPRHAGRRWERGYCRFRRWLRGGRLRLERRKGIGVPFAGRRRVGCRTSARWAAIGSEAYGVSADGSVVVGWAWNAPWLMACLSLDGSGWAWRT